MIIKVKSVDNGTFNAEATIADEVAFKSIENVNGTLIMPTDGMEYAVNWARAQGAHGEVEIAYSSDGKHFSVFDCDIDYCVFDGDGYPVNPLYC